MVNNPPVKAFFVSLLLSLPLSGAIVSLDPVLASYGHGAVLNSGPNLIGGLVVSTVDSNGSTDQLLIVDTSQPLPADPDLLIRPAVGWAIGISEGGRPDDERRGGEINLTFPAPSNFFQFRAIDSEEGIRFTFELESGSSFTTPYSFTPDGEAGMIQTFFFPISPLVSATAEIRGSGVIGGLAIQESVGIVPEPSCAILAILGLFPLILRRR